MTDTDLPSFPDNTPKLGSRWRHFKGTVYTVAAIARDCETKEPVIVYCDSKDGLVGPEAFWVRKLSDWEVEARPGVKRFEPEFIIGQHVTHTIFGRGRIVATGPTAVRIDFEFHGVKELALAFAADKIQRVTSDAPA